MCMETTKRNVRLHESATLQCNIRRMELYKVSAKSISPMLTEAKSYVELIIGTTKSNFNACALVPPVSS